MPEINATATAVYECSWLPNRWQWSAAGPGGMSFGGAATKDEAWEKAREAAKTLGVIPKGNG